MVSAKFKMQYSCRKQVVGLMKGHTGSLDRIAYYLAYSLCDVFTGVYLGVMFFNLQVYHIYYFIASDAALYKLKLYNIVFAEVAVLPALPSLGALLWTLKLKSGSRAWEKSKVCCEIKDKNAVWFQLRTRGLPRSDVKWESWSSTPLLHHVLVWRLIFHYLLCL